MVTRSDIDKLAGEIERLAAAIAAVTQREQNPAPWLLESERGRLRAAIDALLVDANARGLRTVEAGLRLARWRRRTVPLVFIRRMIDEWSHGRADFTDTELEHLRAIAAHHGPSSLEFDRALIAINTSPERVAAREAATAGLRAELAREQAAAAAKRTAAEATRQPPPASPPPTSSTGTTWSPRTARPFRTVR